VLPDLTALAKILAGGFPGGAVAGRRNIMELLEIHEDADWMRRRKMPHQGTFNANPLSASAGIATLDIVRSGEPCRVANERAVALRSGMNDVIDKHRLNWCVHGKFSEFRFLIDHGLAGRRASSIDPAEIHYTLLKQPVNPALRHLRCAMLMNGVDHPLSGGLTMAAHTAEDIERTIEAFDRSLHAMKREHLV
jgi:glutamate-1-semialdehyde 2,1-aminomutase